MVVSNNCTFKAKECCAVLYCEWAYKLQVSNKHWHKSSNTINNSPISTITQIFLQRQANVSALFSLMVISHNLLSPVPSCYCSYPHDQCIKQ